MLFRPSFLKIVSYVSEVQTRLYSQSEILELFARNGGFRESTKCNFDFRIEEWTLGELLLDTVEFCISHE